MDIGQMWSTLEAAVPLLSDNMKATISEAACTKERLIAEGTKAREKGKVDTTCGVGKRRGNER
jgi:hypothetical protein